METKDVRWIGCSAGTTADGTLWIRCGVALGCVYRESEARRLLGQADGVQPMTEAPENFVFQAIGAMRFASWGQPPKTMTRSSRKRPAVEASHTEEDPVAVTEEDAAAVAAAAAAAAAADEEARRLKYIEMENTRLAKLERRRNREREKKQFMEQERLRLIAEERERVLREAAEERGRREEVMAKAVEQWQKDKEARRLAGTDERDRRREAFVNSFEPRTIYTRRPWRNRIKSTEETNEIRESDLMDMEDILSTEYRNAERAQEERAQKARERRRNAYNGMNRF